MRSLAHCRHSTSISSPQSTGNSLAWEYHITRKKNQWLLSVDQFYPKSLQKELGLLMTTSVLLQGESSGVHRNYFLPSFTTPEVFPAISIAVHQKGCVCLCQTQGRGTVLRWEACFHGAWRGERRLPAHRVPDSSTPQPPSVMQTSSAQEAHAHSKLTNFQTCSIKTPTLSQLQFLQNDILPAVNLQSCRLVLYSWQNHQKGKLEWGGEH